MVYEEWGGEEKSKPVWGRTPDPAESADFKQEGLERFDQLLEQATGKLVGAMEGDELILSDNDIDREAVQGLLTADPESAVFDHQLVAVPGMAGAGSQMEPMGPMITHFLGEEVVCRKKEYYEAAPVYCIHADEFEERVTKDDYNKFLAEIKTRHQAAQERLAAIDPRVLGELRDKVTAFIDNLAIAE
jgi:hypothetical protein